VRRARLAFTVLAAIVVVALAAVAVKLAWPRYRIARHVARAETATGNERAVALRELAVLGEPEAIVELVGVYARRGDAQAEAMLRRTVELHVSIEPPDPQVRAVLGELARDPLADERRRLFAFYLIEELDDPSFHEPLAKTRDDAVGRRSWLHYGEEPLPVSPTGMDRGVPKNLRDRLERGQIVLIPPADLGPYVVFPYENLDPKKVLRALAALRGCVVTTTDVRLNHGQTVLEVRRR
jgi:hypothetical protein